MHAELGVKARCSMEEIDAARPGQRGIFESTSNIFRTKSRRLETQSSKLGRSSAASTLVSAQNSGAYDGPAHWAIAVPTGPSEAEPADHPRYVELASGLSYAVSPSAYLNPLQAHASLEHNKAIQPESSPLHGPPAMPSQTPKADRTSNPLPSSQGNPEMSNPPEFNLQAAAGVGAGTCPVPINRAADNSAMHAVPSQAGTKKPASCISWQPVGVDIYSLGSFAFKGINKQQHIAQVVPTALASRLELFRHVVKRGKATCIKQDDSHIQSVTMWLPDLTGLKLAS